MSIQDSIRVPVRICRTELRERISKGRDIVSARRRTDAEQDVFEQAGKQWLGATRLFLQNVLVEDSYLARQFLPRGDEDVYSGVSAPRLAQLLETDLASLRNFDELLASVGEVEEMARVDGGAVPSVFIVHGRSIPLLMEVELFCRRISALDVVVLKDQASRGATVIEKLERHLDRATDYVIVLLTADDVGKLESGSDLLPRARQNVVLELGFAMGCIGRSRVVVLAQPGVEVPSDVAGMVFVNLDAAGGWKMELYNELKAAGLDVSL